MRALVCAGLLLLGCAASDADQGGARFVGVSVTDDPNGDGRLSPGESASLRLEFEGASVSVDCQPVSATAGVTVSDPDERVRVGYCGGTCAADFRIQVGAQVPPGSRARFQCGDLAFEVPIAAPDVTLRVATLRVDEDSNGDGVLNPGESAEISVGLRNDGASAVTGSRCVVGALTAGVDVTDASLSYYFCKGGEDCGESSFRVQVAPDVAPGTVARFACALVDQQDATRSVEIAARVEASAAHPLFDGYSTEGGRPLVPGYTGDLRVRLQNVGPSALTGSRCTVTSDQAWLTVQSFDDGLSYYHCPADSDCDDDSIAIAVADDAPPGGHATLTCPLVDAEERTWPLTLPVTLEQ
jgi:hypothetical protein